MTVRWLSAALEDLRGIRTYISRDSPVAARRVVERIGVAVEQLDDHPLMGRAGRLPATRELVVGRLPYIVAYRVIGVNIEILAVVHTSRRWPDELA